MSVNIIDPNLQFTNAQIKRKSTKKIILHHALAVKASVYDIHKWHLENGWIGIGYHFYVTKDGKIYKGRNIDSVGSHCTNNNSDSVGICAEGNYMIETMPTAQKNAIVSLIRHVRGIYGNIVVGGHKNYDSSECPGTNFPLQEVIKLADQPEQHWAKPMYDYLNANGITITEERFNDNITRGEAIALVYKVIKYINDNK